MSDLFLNHNRQKAEKTGVRQVYTVTQREDIREELRKGSVKLAESGNSALSWQGGPGPQDSTRMCELTSSCLEKFTKSKVFAHFAPLRLKYNL